MKTKILILFLVLALLPMAGKAQVIYTTNGTAITISGTGPIPDFAFLENSTITSVTIGKGITGIGYEAFYFCSSLRSVVIPNSVTSIGNYAFYGTGLTNIAVDAANPEYAGVGGVLFNKALTTLIQYPSGLTASSYTIPNSVTSIGDGAFYHCTSLTSVTIGSGVTSIGTAAFDYCFSLTSVTIPNSVTNIGYGAFGDCDSLTSVVIPNSVTSIGWYAFDGCTSLTNITFLGNAPTLGSAFGVGLGAKVYYYYGTTGWGTTYGDLPTVMLGAPAPQVGAGSAGVKPGGFGFTLNGVTNQTIVVEASTDLANWQPIWTNTLSTLSTNFVDPDWVNYPQRFYRLRSN